MKYEADYDCKARIKVKNFILSVLVAVMPFSTGSKSFLLFPPAARMRKFPRILNSFSLKLFTLKQRQQNFEPPTKGMNSSHYF
jgi:hypothetical protein